MIARWYMMVPVQTTVQGLKGVMAKPIAMPVRLKGKGLAPNK